MEAKIYNQKGVETGSIELPKAIFSLPWNDDLVHQVITSMQSNVRVNVADTKGRAEVRGGGRKPWRQKGTGRARHGSSRSPIWVGGGVTHGPTSERNFKKKINKKMNAKALFTILSAKAKDNEVIFFDEISGKEAKAKVAAETLNNLSKAGFAKINYKIGKRVLIAIPEHNVNIKKTFANIKSAHVEEISKINPLDVITYKYVMFVDPKACLEGIAKRIK